MMNQEKTGKFIAGLRKEKKMTQEQLAEKLGVSNRSVSRWENGNTMPELSLLQTLAKELGVTVPELLNGERLEKTGSDKKNIDLVIEFSRQENERKAKRLNRHFFAGLVCLLLVILQERFSILAFLSKPSLESFLYGILLILGMLFEIMGFYENLKTKIFTPKEVEIISNTDGTVQMKTAGEMLQFARKYQKAELRQYELAFQKIAENLHEDEWVAFSMVGDGYTIGDHPGPWHICAAVTPKRLLLCGESVRGRIFTGYDMDDIPRRDISSVELDRGKIVLNTAQGVVKLEGKDMDHRMEELKEALL